MIARVESERCTMTFENRTLQITRKTPPFCRKRMLKPHRFLSACASSHQQQGFVIRLGSCNIEHLKSLHIKYYPHPPAPAKKSHLKRNHFNRKIVFQPTSFRGYVSFSEEYQVIPPWNVIKIIAKTSSSSFAKRHSLLPGDASQR